MLFTHIQVRYVIIKQTRKLNHYNKPIIQNYKVTVLFAPVLVFITSVRQSVGYDQIVGDHVRLGAVTSDTCNFIYLGN